jgi:hypothetical protein
MSDSSTVANRITANGTAPIGIDSNGRALNGNGTAAAGSTASNSQIESTTKENLANLTAWQGYGAYRREKARRGAISGPSADYCNGTFDEEADMGENEG